ncbi:LysM peptidoglycan-binding domain-containing M23 family metallopeptidase [Candidatus Berkelbacteria bacterium]|nr:LysM peptidoglycan-binding domain-containing M23 family metallopeptidase [Candidatus Berkelbacteria bacterium]
MLGLVVAAWNLFQADQDRFAFASTHQAQYLDVDPSRANIVLAAIDEYTPLINESAIDLRSSLRSDTEAGFLGTEQLEHRFTTEATKLEVEYEVQNGDTIMGIADKFGLHVATIAERNELGVDEIESLKPGQTLIIPPADTSDSIAWLEELNKKKEAERQKAIAEAAKQRTLLAQRNPKTTTRQTASGGFERAAGMSFIVPIGHKGISRGVSRFHMGIDYRADTGTAVKAAQDGRVVETTGGWAGGFGISILVDHGGGLNTRYAHLSRIAVSPGQTVSQGQVIGYSGNTGYSTGPHLHFETRQNGRVLSPF